jgi:hypothetical protein
MQVCKPCHFTMVEAVKPFKLHPTSMSYLYKVFDHPQLLGMGIWLHTHTVSSTTDVSPDLGELAEILGDGDNLLSSLFVYFKCANHTTTLWLSL